MSKRASKLDDFAAQLDQWLPSKDNGGDALTYAQAAEKLAALGCEVHGSRICKWWTARASAKRCATLLGNITSGAKQCADVEAEFARNPAPGIDTLIKLHRVIIMKLSTDAEVDPALLKMVTMLMSSVLKAKDQELDQQKLEHDARRLKLLEEKVRDARVEVEKLRDPKQALGEDERKAIIGKVDEILGLK